MRVMGIDPGLATVGFGIVDSAGTFNFRPVEFGAVLTPAGEKTEDRLLEIYANIDELVNTFKPDAVSIEKLFFNTNEKTAINVAQARGVILLAVRKNNIPIFEYTPMQVKQAVTGYGRAEKAQIQTMMRMLLGLPAVPKPDDVADALAIAICHAHSHKNIQSFRKGI
ncbi:MAG: crossover junction endodeoxyribonuclease RuvC [Clostridia bacterium]|nr:crossover junction endodeoxyribonuclease RuvC [Clostridia bacterium]